MKLLLRLFGRKLYYVIFRVRNTVTLYSTDVYVLVTHKRQVESKCGLKNPRRNLGEKPPGIEGGDTLKISNSAVERSDDAPKNDRKEKTEGTSFLSIIYYVQILCQFISFFYQSDNRWRISANIPLGIGRKRFDVFPIKSLVGFDNKQTSRRRLFQQRTDQF